MLTFPDAVTKLDRNAFAEALKHGRGTALMHVLVHGLDGVEDLVLAACIENQAYDRQCEDYRSDWLYGMFKNTPACSRFLQAFIAALKSDEDDCCTEQVCDLVSLMARDGDTAAALALREHVWSNPDSCEGISGGHALVALDGLPAAMECARRMGRFLLENPGEYTDSLDYLTEGTPYFEEAFFEMKHQALLDPAIAAYFAIQDERLNEKVASKNETAEQLEASRLRHREERLREFPLARILAAASESRTERRYFYSGFGLAASAEDLECVLQHLRTEADPETCKRLLWVFSKGALPRVDDRVWELANGAASRVRDAAIMALSYICDPRVGELGRQWLRDEKFSAADSEAIELLALNFQDGDVALILSALGRLTINDDDAHALARSVEQVCIENNSIEVVPLLEWICRTNPCTICRLSAVELLLESEGLSPAIARECLYDASSRTRELAACRSSSSNVAR